MAQKRAHSVNGYSHNMRQVGPKFEHQLHVVGPNEMAVDVLHENLEAQDFGYMHLT